MIRLLRKIYERIISGFSQVTAFLNTISGQISNFNYNFLGVVRETKQHKQIKVVLVGGSNFQDSEKEFSDFIVNQDNQEYFTITNDGNFPIVKNRANKDFTDLNHINIGAINYDGSNIITIRINGFSAQDGGLNNLLTFYVLPNSVLNKSIDYSIPVTLANRRNFGEIEVTGINSGSTVDITISHYPFLKT